MVSCIRNYALLVDNIQCDRGIKEIIQKIDSINNAIEAVMQLFGENYTLINLELRNIFKAGATRSTLKYVIGYNHYGKRYKIINFNIICSKCPRCDKEEIQEYVTQCESQIEHNETFLCILDIKLNKILRTNNGNIVKESMLCDIREFLIG